ncbi:MAG: nitrate- and nitrite sensing domain-containing protein [Streptosporangiales bacterium]
MSVDSPARPALPDPAPWLADPAKGPRDRKGSRLALRNWRVPWRLIALIAIPTVVAMAFAGLRVAAAAGSAANFGRSAQLAALGQQVTGLAQAMEDERDLSANFIADGRPAADRATLQRQYAVTNAWAQRVGAQMRGVGGAFPAQTQADAAAVIARIADLPNLRSYAMAGNAPALTVITNYTLALADLLTFDDAIAQQAGSSALVTSVRTLGSLSRMKDQESLQRAILEAALVSGQFQPGTLDALTTAQTQQATDLASFGTSATLAETQALSNTVAGRPIDLAQAMEQRAIVLGDGGSSLRLGPGASQQWYTDMSYTIGRMRQVERQLADTIARQASALHQGAMRSLILTAAVAAAVLVIVLLATVIIARSLVRPLRQLKAGALEVAEVRLPEEVGELSTAGDADQSVEVEPIGVHSTDEIGQVARAFDQVHQEAVRLAADEARLRGSVSAMFVSLSRRSGSLLERLLRLIDSLELGEQDSERLADLFRMDHLATRMRRNSENLLVLAGQEPPRRWAEPVSLADVARASVSEIEQYDRVVMDLQPGLGVTGNAVADVVHLLAEIIENATTFSQKSTHVTVSGHSLRSGGVLINVIDSGMGMTEEQLAVVNWRLENPPAADVEVSRHMGLFAVAHLADRHGIRVRLRKATGAGLIAHVWLPEALISHDSRPTSWDRIRTERASAVIEAVTRAARFPQDPAAAVALAAAPFAAAPLAEAPLTTASPEEAPGVTAPTAGAPAGASPGEAPAVTASPAEAPAGETAGLIAPAGEAPGAPQALAQQVVVPEPRQRPREIRLPIFESVESDWFRARRRPPPRAGVPLDPHRAAPSWTSPSDEGWRAAETVLAPAADGVTAAGLPRRTPKANLVPGSAGARENGPARAADSAEVISSRLAGFQQGSLRARAAARSAQSSDEQP